MDKWHLCFDWWNVESDDLPGVGSSVVVACWLLRKSTAWSMASAKWSASDRPAKLSPKTCRLSRHWWKVGVAWLYFRPLWMGQLITT